MDPSRQSLWANLTGETQRSAQPAKAVSPLPVRTTGGYARVVTEAAIPFGPEGSNTSTRRSLNKQDAQIINEWIDSGEFENALLQVDMDDLESQRQELEHKLGGRDKGRQRMLE